MNKKIDKRIINNASWIVVGRVFQLILTFITTMLVTRYLGPEKYGIISYSYSYVVLFLPLCTLGMNDIATKEFIENKTESGKMLGTIFVLRFVSSTLSIIFIYLIVSILNNNPMVSYIALLQSLSLVFQIFDTIVYFYQSQLLAKKTGIIYIVAYSLTTVYRIIGLITKKNIEWFALAVSFDFLVVSILLLIVYFSEGNKLSFSFEFAKKLLSKSKHYILSGILIVIYGKVADTLLLGKMVDETTVGYYSAATTLCNAWPFVLTAIIDTSSPIIIDTYANDKNEYKKKMKELYSTIFYIGVIVAIIITIFSKQIVSILYGVDYLPATTPLKIVCWNTIFAYIGVSRYIWIQCEEKTKYETLITLFGAITSVVLNYILISNYGIIGASIALTLTQFLTNFVFLFIMKDTRENAKLILEAILLKDVFK